MNASAREPMNRALERPTLFGTITGILGISAGLQSIQKGRTDRIVTSLISRIRAKNLIAVESAKTLVGAVLDCGRDLKLLRSQCAHGEWLPALKETGISETTARVYMKCAEAAAEQKKKVGWLIENCTSLAELLRCLGISKPCEPGGYNSEVYQRRKLGEQLEMDFSYEEFVPHLKALTSAKNVEQLGATTITRMIHDLEAAAERLREINRNHSALPLEKHESTRQP